MQPIQLIKKYFTDNLAGKIVLDIGTREGEVAKNLSLQGSKVTALDKDDRLDNFENTSVNFLQKNFEEYEVVEIFDIVIAKNVLPFMEKGMINKILTTGNFIIFNIWGKSHQWAKEDNSFSIDEINNLRDTISKTFKTHYFSDEEFETNSYKNESVHWHQYTFCVERALK